MDDNRLGSADKGERLECEVADTGRLAKLIRFATNKKNIKYFSADFGGFCCGLAAATGATIGLKEAGFSDEANVVLTLGAKLTGFAAGNIATYLFVHRDEYRNKEKNLKRDLMTLAASNIHGAGAAGFLKVAGHYALLKLTDIPYYFLPAIVYPAAGFAGTICRHWKNYKSGLIGNYKKDAVLKENPSIKS